MDRISNDVACRKWDTLEKCAEPTPTVFVNMRVDESNVRVDVEFVQIAWLALFDSVSSRSMTTSVVPMVRMLAHGDQVRTFEVLLDDFIAGTCGPIDAVVGIVSDSFLPETLLDVRVYDSRTTSVYSSSESDGSSDSKVKASDFYPIVPLWMDTVVPMVNISCQIKIKFKRGTPRSFGERIVCAIMDPWTKLNVAMASSFVLPDGSIWPPASPNDDVSSMGSRRTPRGIHLPDIESVQRMRGAFDRCRTRNSAIFQELSQKIWDPDRLRRLGLFDVLDEL